MNVIAALRGEVLAVTHLGRSIDQRDQREALYQARRSLEHLIRRAFPADWGAQRVRKT
ncbi:MAG: hypothetical protein ACREX9_09990 [Gammaproteobacteria bacterium]